MYGSSSSPCTVRFPPTPVKPWLDYDVKDNGINVSVPESLKGNAIAQNAARELKSCKYLKDLDVSLKLVNDENLNEEGYRITKNGRKVCICATSESGLIYGAFRFIALSRLGMEDGTVTEVPASKLRMLNHWDNMDGSIERGYSGNSFFFVDNEIVIDDRTRHYARLLSSLAYNGVVINNVNVKEEACNLINEKYIYKVKELNDLFKSYGVNLYLSINYAATMEDEGVASADPLDEKVIKWWQDKIDYVYSIIPDLGGFLVKADSEGRPGPFTYGRTQAEGANMLARAIKKHNGIIIWRCFVYNCQQDWRDLKTDRARAAYDYFHDLDGKFDQNVILQIKNGPMDFQIREPITPLFGKMPKTNCMIEYQIAQEYTGHQLHVCYLIPWFKEVLEFETYAKGTTPDNSRVVDVVTGKTFGYKLNGMCAVTNTGNDENWTGHDLAAANLYGFGRLAFNPDLSSEEIAEEWIKLTFGDNRKVVENIRKILMMSWPAYEKYSAPLGIGWMVKPNTHYGPDPDGYEYDRWGTYHKATCKTIGLERNSTGTGYSTQYNEPWASLYEKPETTPDKDILFFHKLPYEYKLKSGKTIIQHIYDTHFEGAEDVEVMSKLWDELKGLIDEDAFKRARARLDHQLDHSKEWRDVINSYFYRKTMIEDEKGRELY
ncbi:MAG: alpha-glucuronidase [Lachnospiraceae bacterium]|nr:alpha-glucuronidase [Lachnospiraceae bacterium]